ncbi:MAG TPA: exodeoxyribonuclease VII small subunit [bacterium]|nr:exodeoxyribonuclease VII small subunit [bacterium]
MAEPSFEEAMKRIEAIVADLEKSDIPLEQALERFEEAVKLAKMCHRKLDEAQKRVTKLVGTEDGGFALEPFEESRED